MPRKMLIVSICKDMILIWVLGQVHRSLSTATGEHQSRFGIVSTEIRDVVLVQVAVKPAWMVPEAQASRTAKDVELEMRLQVKNVDSVLRQIIPTLFRIAEVGNDQDSIYAQSDSSSSTTSHDEGESEISDLGAGAPDIVADVEPLISFATCSDEEEVPFGLKASFTPKPARAVVSAPTSYVEESVANKRRDAGRHVEQLEGAELYSMARQSLACRDKKSKQSDQSNLMFTHYMHCVGGKHYATRHLRKFMVAWHQLRQDGIVSDATEDMHEAELPDPTFHHGATTETLEEDLIDFSRSNGKRRSNAAARQHAAQASLSAPSPAALPLEEDEEAMPPIWNKLIEHMQNTRDRNTQRRALSEWLALVARPSAQVDEETAKENRAARRRAEFLNHQLDDIC